MAKVPYVFNLTIGDDGSPKVILSFGGAAEEGSPAVRLTSAVLDIVNLVTDKLAEEGINVQFTVFDGSRKNG